MAATHKGLTLRANAPIGAAIHSDRKRLERILGNLVSNAVKFTDRGDVRVEVEPRSRRVNIHVVDTGIGIAPQDREHLFEEFFQVHNAERNRTKGFGLGLAIARRLARQLGGDVTVESAEGHGSRFTVVLPTVVGPANSDVRPEAAPPLAADPQTAVLTDPVAKDR
jgi:two-component system, sensor histidine kinase